MNRTKCKCDICNRNFTSLSSLSKHINFIHHIDKLTYYKTYISTSPLDGYCKMCGKPTRFKGLLGYSAHCSNRCAQKDPITLEKVHTIEHEKHVSEGVRKAYNKKTQIKKVEKTRKNNLLKYGVENAAQRPDVKEKLKNTIKTKREQFCRDNNCTSRQDLIELFGQGWLKLNLPVLKNGRTSFIENKYIEIISKYSSKSSMYEEIIYHWLENIYDGLILRHRRPKFLNGLELDFFLPELNLAIEYNGSYYHCIGNDVGVQSVWYHYYKSYDCYCAGIRLIHIFEFESLFRELMLLKSLIYYGKDRYNLKNPNKYFEPDGHFPTIIGYYKEFPIYSA